MMQPLTLRAILTTPVVIQGYSTLDAILMATLQTGDVSHLLKAEDGLYFASAAFFKDPAPFKQKVSFVASMRPEHTPEWREIIRPNTRNPDAPPIENQGERKANLNDLRIGLARQREAGNIVNGYQATAASAVEWYATGDATAVLEVVKDISFIGKRRSSGYGQVAGWEVESGELDGVCGYLSEPLRPVPVDRWSYGGDWVPLEAAWKAPYWDVRNRTKCFAPEQT